MGVMVQPIEAYNPALRGRHMQQPPLEKGVYGQGDPLGWIGNSNGIFARCL
jgi:hypothetical protein